MSVDDPLPSTPLRLVTLEVEAHVAAEGWDQPPRLYALVPTAQLVEHEPALAASLSAQLEAQPDGFTSIEQDGLPPDRSFEALLDEIEWPDAVAGCVAVVERVMLPPEAEDELPDDEDALMTFVSEHPESREVRLDRRGDARRRTSQRRSGA